VSFTFGILASTIGVLVVFFTLLAVVAVSEVLRRLYSSVEVSQNDDRKLEKIAAMAAVQYYISLKEGPTRMRASDSSRWSTIARIEALGLRRERFR